MAVDVKPVGAVALGHDLVAMSKPGGKLAKALVATARQVDSPLADVTRSSVPQVSGRLAGSVVVEDEAAGADVVMGSSAVRYAGWVEFGGHRRAPHPSYRTYDPRGRYLFPHAVGMTTKATDAFAVTIQQTLDSYPWTNRTTDPAAVHD